MSDLVIVVPLWRRTANIERLLTSITATTDPEVARVLFVVSEGDEAFQHVIIDGGLQPVDLLVVPGAGGGGGDYARKINAGYRASDEEWIFTGADDLVFTPGWWEAAKRAAHRAPWQDQARVGVIGTNDDCNDRVMAGEHSTHSLVARWYADAGCSVGQVGMIYHEGYDHDHCDDELVQTAMSRGAFVHAHDSVVRHYHPMAGRAEDDETYQRGRARTRLSHTLYRRRQRLWRTD